MGDLSGRTAVVTGSSRSIGAEIARALAAAGADVVVNGRSSLEETQAVADECAAFGVEACAVIADVSSPEGAEALAKAALERFGKVDILVNNVGISPRLPFLDTTVEDWHKTFAINVDSVFLCAKYMAPSMISRKWGRIVNLTGHAYLTVGGKALATKASKAAIVGLTRGLAGELAQYQITCNHVAPSLIDTPPRRNKYYKESFEPNWDPEARGVNEVPLKRLGKPSEVAAMVKFLCTEDAAYLTGQTYLVNGGVYAV